MTFDPLRKPAFDAAPRQAEDPKIMRLSPVQIPKRPLLSVLMPVFNEARTVEACLRRVEAVDLDLELIVVDDGSTDGTREILQGYAANRDPRKVRVVLNPENRGKGFALRTAIPLARGEISIIQDADLEYDPAEYAKVIEPIRSGAAQVSYGSRKAGRKAAGERKDLFLLGAWVLTELANVIYGCRLTDEATCYKAFRTELLQSIPLRCTGFEFCPEVTAKVCKRQQRIAEVNIGYAQRTVAEGKKINWKDGVVGVWTLLKYRFVD